MNLEPFFGVLLEEGKVTPKQLREYDRDGEPYVTLEDCCDWHEALMRRAENEHRMYEKAKASTR